MYESEWCRTVYPELQTCTAHVVFTMNGPFDAIELRRDDTRVIQKHSLVSDCQSHTKMQGVWVTSGCCGETNGTEIFPQAMYTCLTIAVCTGRFNTKNCISVHTVFVSCNCYCKATFWYTVSSTDTSLFPLCLY